MKIINWHILGGAFWNSFVLFLGLLNLFFCNREGYNVNFRFFFWNSGRWERFLESVLVFFSRLFQFALQIHRWFSPCCLIFLCKFWRVFVRSLSCLCDVLSFPRIYHEISPKSSQVLDFFWGNTKKSDLTHLSSKILWKSSIDTS